MKTLYVLYFNKHTCSYIFIKKVLGDRLPNIVTANKKFPHLHGLRYAYIKNSVHCVVTEDLFQSMDDTFDHSLKDFQCYITLDQDEMLQTIGDLFLQFDKRYEEHTEELFLDIIRDTESKAISWEDFYKCKELSTLIQVCTVEPLSEKYQS